MYWWRYGDVILILGRIAANTLLIHMEFSQFDDLCVRWKKKQRDGVWHWESDVLYCWYARNMYLYVVHAMCQQRARKLLCVWNAVRHTLVLVYAQNWLVFSTKRKKKNIESCSVKIQSLVASIESLVAP